MACISDKLILGGTAVNDAKKSPLNPLQQYKTAGDHYDSVYSASYQHRQDIRTSLIYRRQLHHGIGKPFFTSVPAKLDNDYLPSAPSIPEHHLTVSPVQNQPFRFTLDTIRNSLSEHRDRFPRHLVNGPEIFATANEAKFDVQDTAVSTPFQAKSQLLRSGYTRGQLNPIRNEDETERFTADSDGGSVGPVPLQTFQFPVPPLRILPGMIAYQAEKVGCTGPTKNAIKRHYLGDGHWHGNLAPVKITIPALISPTNVSTVKTKDPHIIDTDGPHLIQPSKVSAVDMVKNLWGPIYPGHGFVGNSLPVLPSIPTTGEAATAKNGTGSVDSEISEQMLQRKLLKPLPQISKHSNSLAIANNDDEDDGLLIALGIDPVTIARLVLKQRVMVLPHPSAVRRRRRCSEQMMSPAAKSVLTASASDTKVKSTETAGLKSESVFLKETKHQSGFSVRGETQVLAADSRPAGVSEFHQEYQWRGWHVPLKTTLSDSHSGLLTGGKYSCLNRCC